MKKERYWPVLGTWLKDTTTTPPDPQQTARKVAERIPETPQVRRRWWLPSLRRTPTPLHSYNQTTDHQPTSIPATNGHTPTVTGRTQSMFSPAKAITAGALVFAIGGVLLIAQPFDQQGGGVPGAATDAEAVPATWVTGDITFAPSCSGPTREVDAGVRRERDYLCEPQRWTSSDPRLTGEAAAHWNADVYEPDGDAPGSSISVTTVAYYLRNEAGGWACHSNALAHGYGSNAAYETGETAMCVGDGEYDGLSAILVVDFATSPATFVGLIFPGDAPPLPEPPAAE
jgi:hypothetical protein